MSITISREGENDETLAKRALRRTLATVKPDIGSLSAVLNFSCAPPLYPHQLAGMDVANPCRSPRPMEPPPVLACRVRRHEAPVSHRPA